MTILSKILFLFLYYFEFNCSSILKKVGNGLYIPKIATFTGNVRIPSSKSITNRVLLLSSLAQGNTQIVNPLFSQDTNIMIRSLEALGVKLEVNLDNICVSGNPNGFKTKDSLEIFVGNAGTVLRPLVSILSAGYGHFILKGDNQMNKRPLSDLLIALKKLKVRISSENGSNPPVEIMANGIYGGEIEISGKISSQFISSLLMMAPLTKKGLRVQLSDNLISAPYVYLTIDIMKRFGSEVQITPNGEFIVRPGPYLSPKVFNVEGDATSASYFMAGAAISGKQVCITGIGSNSLQGDIQICDLLRKMGAEVNLFDNQINISRSRQNKLKGIEIDCINIPDAAMTLAILGVFCEGKTILKNVRSWKVKECDRLYAISKELKKLGVQVTTSDDSITIEGIGGTNYSLNSNVIIETYNDHRIAMCFSLIALGGYPIIINNPECVNKTFPNYFDYFENLSKI